MPFVSEILAHTPPWVFVLLFFLIWQGVQALRPRTQPVWRLIIVPAVFLVLGLSMLALHGASSPRPVVAWLAACILLLPVGLATGPRLLAVDRSTAQVTRAGSVVPLLRNVSLFLLQYGFAVAAALHPHDQPALAILGRAVSGATAGYFIGWAIILRQRYRVAPARPPA